jgi:hypothetical protein
MTKFLWRSLLLSPAILGATLVCSPNVLAADSTADALEPQAAPQASSEMFTLNTEAAVTPIAATDLGQANTVKVEELTKQPEVVAQVNSAAPVAPASTIQQINRYNKEGAR